MITGYNGIAMQIAENGYDDDEVIELLMSLSAINGITTESTEDSVTYSVTVNGKSCPLFVLTAPWYSFSLHVKELTLFFEENDIPPFYADTIFRDLCDIMHGTRIPFETALTNKDEIILAVYRLMHLIKYDD